MSGLSSNDNSPIKKRREETLKGNGSEKKRLFSDDE
jgi:hypothetical protein